LSGSAKLLIVGFVLLIALGIGLLRFLGGSSDPATTSPSRQPSTNASKDREPSGTKSEPKPEAKSESAPVTSVRPRPAIADTFLTKMPPEEEPDRDEHGLVIPIINKPDIGIANVTTDEKMRECIVKHGFTRGNGTAVLTFIVGKKKDERGQVKIAVEDSGYEEEGLTINDTTVLECLHKTAFEMQFGPPKNVKGVPVWGKRKIRIEDGMLRENSIIDIGRIR
jgi:hypothetical protein